VPQNQHVAAGTEERGPDPNPRGSSRFACPTGDNDNYATIEAIGNGTGHDECRVDAFGANIRVPGGVRPSFFFLDEREQIS
jgi:hypothetical protein